MAEVIADSNDVLLHPDALHCLKRRQLENLCIRLDLKATGKKDELVARLEGYAKGKVALGSSPSRGKMVRARPRTRTMSTRTVNSQTTIGGDENYDVDQEMNETVQENGEEEDEEDVKGVLTAAGPSIRLITSQGGENDDGDVGQIFESYSGGNSRTPLGEVAGNECQQTEATSLVTSSSTSKSIYPWKRIASTSIPKLKRNFSSASTVKGKDDSFSSHTTEEDRKSINAEFGVGGSSAKQEEGGSMPRNGSLSSLKKWLSKSKSTLASSSSSPSLDQEMASPPSHPTTSTPPSEPVLAEKVSSPTATKRKHGDEEGIASALANQEVEEIPVKRVIKGRPSRAIRQNQNVAAASSSPPPPVNLSSPTSITKDDFSKAVSKVMEEVNARLQQSGKATMVQIPKQGAWSVSSVGAGGSGGGGLQPPSSPLKSVNSRTKGRFSGEHAKHFGKMDSIASHYAAKRIEQANKEWRSTSSGSSKSNKSSASSTHPTTNKRIKIAEQSEDQVVKAAESRAIVQRKLDLSRQRRKSAGRKSVGVSSSTPRAGFRSKISGAMRGFVGAARGKTASSNSSNTQQIRSAVTPVQQAKGPAEVQRKVTPPQRSVVIPPRSASGKDKASTPQQQQTASRSKPAFDLKASLARKPRGYTPYSAKETVQLLQTNPAGLNASPTKTLFPTTAAVNTPSPIRSGWTFIPSPNGNGTPATHKMDNAEASSSTSTFSSSIVFPSVSPSPAKQQPNQSDDLASQVRAAPRIIRQPSAHITAARKTRSSISNAKRATGQVQSQQADRLKKAARVNELKHQASMAARRRTGSAIQRAVERGERIAAEINSGTGRGSPRKASGRITMEGAGRGSAAVKRVS